VPVLAGYLDNENLLSAILDVFAVIAWFPETGIDPHLYRALMEGFDGYGYDQKYGLLRVFCNLAVKHTHDVVVMGHCAALLINALDTVDTSDDLFISPPFSGHSMNCCPRIIASSRSAERMK
jgi:hypothetical protein